MSRVLSKCTRLPSSVRIAYSPGLSNHFAHTHSLPVLAMASVCLPDSCVPCKVSSIHCNNYITQYSFTCACGWSDCLIHPEWNRKFVWFFCITLSNYCPGHIFGIISSSSVAKIFYVLDYSIHSHQQHRSFLFSPMHYKYSLLEADSKPHS